MKKLFMSLALFGVMLIPAQGAFAWSVSQLNPLPYIGIGQNTSSFSLNPFNGFKNCNPCKAEKPKCNACEALKPACPCQRVVVNPCTNCAKAFPDKPCPCNKIIYDY